MSHCCDSADDDKTLVDTNAHLAHEIKSGLQKAHEERERVEFGNATETPAAMQTADELVFARELFPPDGVVVLKFAERLTIENRKIIAAEVEKTLVRASSKCQVMVCGPELSLYMLPPKTMAELGWIRAKTSWIDRVWKRRK